MIDHKLQLFLEKELLSKWSKRIIFTPDMKLYKDFGLVGDDVDDFLLHFTKEFNITFSNKFNFDERFYPEAYTIFDVFKNIYNKIKGIFSQKTTNAPELKDLSIAELQEAIKTGVLK
ncbi:Protein of unknown function (DUF1493) [Apibacter mensalis]|uniref:DUF1493 family protein n=1 Tax=Apibacter mensalis TaxID=1586267 RepID=A0A0X3ARG2_9FLAO|nr:DUF1493 family protein [Apibacter mensalis]CVK16924.1 Protein of unknown function (DUF1493) [Apibacter mensalis]